MSGVYCTGGEIVGEIKLCLSDILVFATGASGIPVLGFSPQPTLMFIHKEDLPEDELYMAGLPRANTCSMSLSLPIVDDYDDLKTMLLEALPVLNIFFSKE